MSKTKKALLGIILFAIDFAITGYATRYIWNSVFSSFFGFRTITFWQGYILSLAFSYFLPKFRSKDDDTVEKLITDIIYTILVWVIVFLLVTFIGI